MLVDKIEIGPPAAAGAVRSGEEVLSQVAAAGRPVIVRRNGEDLAAVIPLEHLELVREILARQEMERSAAEMDWSLAKMTLRPPQSWFDDEDDNPFKPEEEPAS